VGTGVLGLKTLFGEVLAFIIEETVGISCPGEGFYNDSRFYWFFIHLYCGFPFDLDLDLLFSSTAKF
jgi:hypothetical protein